MTKTLVLSIHIYFYGRSQSGPRPIQILKWEFIYWQGDIFIFKQVQAIERNPKGVRHTIKTYRAMYIKLENRHLKLYVQFRIDAFLNTQFDNLLEQHLNPLCRWHSYSIENISVKPSCHVCFHISAKGASQHWYWIYGEWSLTVHDDTKPCHTKSTYTTQGLRYLLSMVLISIT